MTPGASAAMVVRDVSRASGRLCREADARGNLVADAYLTALAIETGSE